MAVPLWRQKLCQVVVALNLRLGLCSRGWGFRGGGSADLSLVHRQEWGVCIVLGREVVRYTGESPAQEREYLIQSNTREEVCLCLPVLGVDSNARI